MLYMPFLYCNSKIHNTIIDCIKGKKYTFSIHVLYMRNEDHNPSVETGYTYVCFLGAHVVTAIVRLHLLIFLFELLLLLSNVATSLIKHFVIAWLP